LPISIFSFGKKFIQSGAFNVSLERALRILENLGLPRTDAEVYVYLAKKGPKSEKDLANALKLAKQQLYSSLKNLQNKGIVTATVEKSALFSAVAFEKVLDLLVKVNIEQAQAIKETKNELLTSWRSMSERDDT
jgi:sugar-specific transcriptional regulator TrmB